MIDKLKARMGLKWIAAATAAIGSLATPSIASADVVPQVDWIRALVELDHLARNKPENPATTASNQRIRPSEDPNPQNMGNAWFGVAPTMTLVARDWANSTRLAGERLAFVDEVRLAASTRMVVGRLRLSSAARFTPFLQVGLGQWRVDRNYMPLLPHTIEVAGQLGTGFEVRVTRRWQIAAEATATSLIRDESSQTLPQTMLWSALVASRIEF